MNKKNNNIFSVDLNKLNNREQEAISLNFKATFDDINAIGSPIAKISNFYSENYIYKLLYFVSFFEKNIREKHGVDVIPWNITDLEEDKVGFVLSDPKKQSLANGNSKLKAFNKKKETAKTKYFKTGREIYTDIISYMTYIIYPAIIPIDQGESSRLTQSNLYVRLYNILESQKSHAPSIKGKVLKALLWILKAIIDFSVLITFKEQKDGEIKKDTVNLSKFYEVLANAKDKLKIEVEGVSIDESKGFSEFFLSASNNDDLLDKVMFLQSHLITGLSETELKNYNRDELFFEMYAATPIAIIGEILTFLQKNGYNRKQSREQIWKVIKSDTIASDLVKGRYYPRDLIETLGDAITNLNLNYEFLGGVINSFDFGEELSNTFQNIYSSVIFESKHVFIGKIDNVLKDAKNGIKVKSHYKLPSELYFANGDSNEQDKLAYNSLMQYSSKSLATEAKNSIERASAKVTTYKDKKTWQAFVRDNTATVLLPKHYLKK